MFAGSPADLAQVAERTVGILILKAALLEIVADGHAFSVEPKVMQVLLVLADAAGRVVSRDELSERCWQGRIVGEDALNRTIAKIRRIGEDQAQGSFRVETVKKVGYRLTERARGATVLAASGKRRSARMPVLLAGAAALVVAAGVLGWKTRGDRRAADRAVAPVVVPAADLETRGLSALFDDTPERTAEGIAYLRQAADATPRRAGIWGALSMAYVLAIPFTPPQQRDAVIARSREAARRAQQLDPHEGRSLAALASLEPTFGNWANKDRLLLRSFAQAPKDTPPLLFQRVQFLTDVGRTREALALVEKLSSVSPLLPWIQSARANLLMTNGRPGEAEQVAGAALETWPRDRLTWLTRFYLLCYSDKPSQARAMAAHGDDWPDQRSGADRKLAARIADALATAEPGRRAALMHELAFVPNTKPGQIEVAFQASVALGRPGAAIGLARRALASGVQAEDRGILLPRIGGDEPNTAFLFLYPGVRIWTRPESVQLARSIGLLDYWRNAHLKPDLCAQIPRAPICQTLAGAEPRSYVPAGQLRGIGISVRRAGYSGIGLHVLSMLRSILEDGMGFRGVFKIVKLAIIGFWIVVFASAGFAIVDPVRAADLMPAEPGSPPA
jgi:DNA-binding winged helix-turn-helix (wHTH) protein/tetratricopeptide (TPR) repeat protein